MATDVEKAEQVFVLLDGVERGPYSIQSLAQDIQNGFPFKDALWRYEQETEYRPIEVLFEPSTQPQQTKLPEQALDDAPNPISNHKRLRELTKIFLVMACWVLTAIWTFGSVMSLNIIVAVASVLAGILGTLVIFVVFGTLDQIEEIAQNGRKQR